MLVPFSGPSTGITDAPVDLLNNYRHLKKLINRALKEGTPLEDLHLIEKHPSKRNQKEFSREDLLKLLHTLRQIRTRYQALMKSPVPKELVRDIPPSPRKIDSPGKMRPSRNMRRGKKTWRPFG